MEILIYWALFTILVTVWANSMGKSVLWCIIGCILFTPVTVAFYYFKNRK
jgi:hypothetical protein